MSLDYGRDVPLMTGTVTPTTTGAEVGAGCWSKDFNYMIKSLSIRVKTANHYQNVFKLQSSDTSGSFSSPTDLATVTVTAASTAGTLYETKVADSLTKLAPGQIVRIWFTTGTTEDTGVYSYAAYGTVTHE